MPEFFDVPLSVVFVAITTCLIVKADKRYWLTGVAVTIITALVESRLELVGLVWLGLLSALLYLYHTREKAVWVYLAATIVLGLMFGLHVLPGFNNVQYLESVQLSAGSAPFDLWYNYDKAFFGILVVAIVLRHELNRSMADWQNMTMRVLPIFAIGIVLTFGLGLSLGYSHLQLNLNAVFWPWVFKNLFFTVIAEEALFRGLIQRHLARHVSGLLSVAIAAVLFGLAHMAGGVQYVVLSSLAGFMYGYAYLKTGRIEAAILTHLMLNVVHFIFFAYPFAL